MTKELDHETTEIEIQAVGFEGDGEGQIVF
jgi:hypothetical protein